MPRRKKNLDLDTAATPVVSKAKPAKEPLSKYVVPLAPMYRSVGRPAIQNFTMLGDNIRRCREAAKLTQPQLAEILNITRNAVANWERDFARPDIERLIQMCSALDVSADDLLGIAPPEERVSAEDRAVLQAFHSLSEHDKRLIHIMMDAMNETLFQEFKENFYDRFRYCPLNPLKACAGSGIELTDERPPMQTLIRITDVTSRCDEIVRITGDSMMPDYLDGDRVLLQHMPEIPVGQVGIFLVNNEGMIKEFRGDHLHPLNPEYPDIYFGEGIEARCIGLVLGKLDADILPTREEQYLINELFEERRAKK